MWRLLFSIAWHAKDSQVPNLREIILDLVARLLPCHQCRLNFHVHKPICSKKMKGEEVTSPEKAFRLLYYFKEEVNKTLVPPSPSLSFSDLKSRYALHDGHLLNDIEVADLMVLVALEASDLSRQCDFRRFCFLLSDLIPVQYDSCLPNQLRSMLEEGRPVVLHSLLIAQSVRKARGFPEKGLDHYKKWGDP